MTGKLILKDGTQILGKSFGFQGSIAGETVFSTGMMGYPESITDPSYKGQILILTYPLVGNYGVPGKNLWESDHIMISGLVVSQYNDTPSHFQSMRTLSDWLRDEKIPALEIKDTRFLTEKIRDHGAMLGKIIVGDDTDFYDPNLVNLVDQVSTKEIIIHKANKSKKKTIILIDCGAKRNIQKSLTQKGMDTIVIPWNFNPFTFEGGETIGQIIRKHKLSKVSGIVISNGPGDPTLALETIQTVKQALGMHVPTLGICLGHQILALAAGGNTKKLKFGHRSQNQPCIMTGTKRCYITTQNHGFAVDRIPQGFSQWFVNANDGTNEGIIHKTLPFMSVQFHPEATPGPTDADFIFDHFLKQI